MTLIDTMMSNELLKKFDISIEVPLTVARENILRSLKAFKLPTKDFLLDKTPRENSGHMKNDTKVEIEKEIEMLVESEIQNAKYTINAYKIWGDIYSGKPSLDSLFFTPDRTDSFKNAPVVKHIRTVLSTKQQLCPYKDIFDEDLCTTQLFQQSVLEQEDPLFGKGTQKHVYQLVFVVEKNGQSRGIIVDTAEASAIRKHMKADLEADRKIHIVDLTTGFSMHKGTTLNDLEEEKLKRLIVQAKFFDGQLSYTKSESKLLKKWLKKIDGALVKTLFEKIIGCHLGLSEKYEESSLKKTLTLSHSHL